jgi:transcriptional regulator with XRE-family HTH domain
MGSRLEHVIARNVTELRTEHNATQSDLAAKMTSHGFAWSTNRVTQIETLRQPVALLEVVGLSYVFSVSVSRLLAGVDEVDLPSGDTMSLKAVREALEGKQPPPRVWTPTPEESAAYQASGEDLRKMAGKLGLRPEDLDALAYRVFGQSFRAEREARTGDVSGLSKRSAQTKRGHVSRALLAAVDDYLGEGKQRRDRLKELHATRDALMGAKS